MLSLSDSLVQKLINVTLPSFQNVDAATHNLGFGFLYYGLVRSLRPTSTVVIGSKAGFTPVIFGLAVKDNEGSGIGKISCYRTSNTLNKSGKVYFIDPSYSIERDDKNHWFGIGKWDVQEDVENLWKSFDVNEIVTHYKITSFDFANSPDCPDQIDLLFIDGDHSYEGMKLDLETFYPKLSKNAIVVMHDVDDRIKELIPDAGGNIIYNELSLELYEKIRLPVFPGLAILKKK